MSAIKVRIAMTVEVDAEDWAREYGLDPTDKPSIREDVKNYVAQGVVEFPVPLNLLKAS